MKTRNRSIRMVAILAGCLALSATRAEAIIINDRPIGLSLGQTLRLNFVNIGDPNQITINYRILDADGVVLAQSEQPLVVPFGRIVSVDLNRDSIPTTRDPRIQIRAQVEVRTRTDLANLRTSVELFDNDTRRTTIFFPPDPCAN
jgi:hypothetical protein